MAFRSRRRRTRTPPPPAPTRKTKIDARLFLLKQQLKNYAESEYTSPQSYSPRSMVKTLVEKLTKSEKDWEYVKAAASDLR